MLLGRLGVVDDPNCLRNRLVRHHHVVVLEALGFPDLATLGRISVVSIVLLLKGDIDILLLLVVERIVRVKPGILLSVKFHLVQGESTDLGHSLTGFSTLTKS